MSILKVQSNLIEALIKKQIINPHLKALFIIQPQTTPTLTLASLKNYYVPYALPKKIPQLPKKDHLTQIEIAGTTLRINHAPRKTNALITAIHKERNLIETKGKPTLGIARMLDEKQHLQQALQLIKILEMNDFKHSIASMRHSVPLDVALDVLKKHIIGFGMNHAQNQSQWLN